MEASTVEEVGWIDSHTDNERPPLGYRGAVALT